MEDEGDSLEHSNSSPPQIKDEVQDEEEEEEPVDEESSRTPPVEQKQPQQQPQFHAGPSRDLCPPETTLWMGDLDAEWNADFVREAFKAFDVEAKNVKMVTDRTGKPASYCFVEFHDDKTARGVMLKVNGRTIPNDTEKRRFNLSFANSPSQRVEYNLFVNNLHHSVDDVTLYKIFGERYPSCRGAKVYRHPDGTSKESGFVRFISETDQQTALVELNKHRLKGREMFLKLAHPRPRGGPRLNSQRPPAPVAPMLLPNHGVAGFGPPQVPYGGMMPPYQAPYMLQQPVFPVQMDDRYRGGNDRRRSSRSYRDRSRSRSRSPRRGSYGRRREYGAISMVPPVQMAPIVTGPPPVYFEDPTPLSPEEHDARLIAMSEDFLTAVESSRWSRILIPPDTRAKDLPALIYESYAS